MTAIKTILVPVDFSTHSRAALEYAVGLARTTGAKLHLVHAYHLPIQVATPEQITMPTDLWTVIRDAAARKLDKSAAVVTDAGLSVETHLCEGNPSSAVVELASKLGVDLIVMGTRGLSGLKHVLLGSVAERTVRMAHCPVLTLKDGKE